MSAAETDKPTAKPGRCSVCAEPSETFICTTCEARIRGEILEEKQKIEKDGHTESGRR
ncbi:MAG: hypothetical protein ACE5FN_02640 [Leptospirillia bacterium]